MVPLLKVGMPPKETLMPALESILYSGMVAEGEAVKRFEEEFANHFKYKNFLSLSSGTAALHTVLTLAGVRPGDEVISTPMTAEPTNLSILYTGATPRWADVHPADGTMDPETIRAVVSPRTKAILVVHYAGYPARMQAINDIAKQIGVPVIEDCAHALGSTYAGKPIGSMSEYAIFSFQAIKHMTTIDGGGLILKDEGQLVDARKFRWFGMLKGISRTEVDITSIGYKYNLHNVAATIGLEQLKYIDNRLDRHIANGEYYDKTLIRIPGITPAKFDTKAKPSYWLYSLLCDDSINAQKALANVGIETSKLHKPNNRHSIFKHISRNLPGLDSFYKRLLHIPCGWWVDGETRELIINTLTKG